MVVYIILSMMHGQANIKPIFKLTVSNTSNLRETGTHFAYPHRTCLWYHMEFIICGIMHPRCCRPATSWLRYTTSCNTQYSASEEGQNDFPKHVELIGIINKPLLLHIVGCLYNFIIDARSSKYQTQIQAYRMQHFKFTRNRYSFCISTSDLFVISHGIYDTD